MAGGVDLWKNLFFFARWFCRGQWVVTDGYYKRFYSAKANSYSQAAVKARRGKIVFYVPTKKEEKEGCNA